MLSLSHCTFFPFSGDYWINNHFFFFCLKIIFCFLSVSAVENIVSSSVENIKPCLFDASNVAMYFRSGLVNNKTELEQSNSDMRIP